MQVFKKADNVFIIKFKFFVWQINSFKSKFYLSSKTTKTTHKLE